MAQPPTRGAGTGEPTGNALTPILLPATPATQCRTAAGTLTLSPPTKSAVIAENQRIEALWREQQAQKQEATATAWAAANDLERLLRDLAPTVFTEPPRPLAIGIYIALVELLAGEVEPATIALFLRGWTKRMAYVRAIAAGGPRFDLDGRPAGDAITPDQRETAARRLAGQGVEPRS